MAQEGYQVPFCDLKPKLDGILPAVKGPLQVSACLLHPYLFMLPHDTSVTRR